jgi:hypothetical protein
MHNTAKKDKGTPGLEKVFHDSRAYPPQIFTRICSVMTAEV